MGFNMILSFELTMPNVGSWNGKWTGDTKQHFTFRTVSQKVANNLIAYQQYFHHDFGDGWCACIKVELVDRKEKGVRQKKAATGFCGYEWMVESLLTHGKIQTQN